MKSTKLLTGFLLASTALPLLSTPLSAEPLEAVTHLDRPLVVAQAASGEIKVRPEVGVSPPSLRGQAGSDDEAERPRRDKSGTQPGEGERQPRGGERRQGASGEPGGAGRAGQAGQGAAGPDKPDAAQPRRTGPGAGDSDAPPPRRATPATESPEPSKPRRETPGAEETAPRPRQPAQPPAASGAEPTPRTGAPGRPAPVDAAPPRSGAAPDAAPTRPPAATAPAAPPSAEQPRPDRLDRPDRPDSLDRPSRPERPDRPERPSRPDRPEPVERPTPPGQTQPATPRQPAPAPTPPATPPSAPPVGQPPGGAVPPAVTPPAPRPPAATAPGTPAAPPTAAPSDPRPPAAEQPRQRPDRTDRPDRPDRQRPVDVAPGAPAQTQPAPAAPPAPPAPTVAPAQPGVAPRSGQPLPAPQVIPGAPGAPPSVAPGAIGPADDRFAPGVAGGRDVRIEELRSLRRERVEEGGRRVIIEEPGDRVIVREGGRVIIRHDETDRFRRVYRDANVRVDRRGTEEVTIVRRPNGVEVVTVRDLEGNLIRRIRREPGGVETVLIENEIRGRPRRREVIEEVVELPPPRVTIPREKYIVEVEGASQDELVEAFTAPPVEQIERRYTLDQVRYSRDLRERVRRVDVDTVTFDFGSWRLSEDQIGALTGVAEAIRRVISQNTSEIFLIEGHTDAVGSDVDNLTLSDRRAETVAAILTERFGIPAENLTTQGYGEQYLKINTQEPERQNRRVTVRRITPLLQQSAGR